MHHINGVYQILLTLLWATGLPHQNRNLPVQLVALFDVVYSHHIQLLGNLHVGDRWTCELHELVWLFTLCNSCVKFTTLTWLPWEAVGIVWMCVDNFTLWLRRRVRERERERAQVTGEGGLCVDSRVIESWGELHSFMYPSTRKPCIMRGG